MLIPAEIGTTVPYNPNRTGALFNFPFSFSNSTTIIKSATERFGDDGNNSDDRDDYMGKHILPCRQRGRQRRKDPAVP